MIVIMLKLLVIVLLSVTGTSAQVTERTTFYMMNGRAWELLSESLQTAYLQGIRDGLLIAASNLPDPTVGKAILDENQAKGFSIDDYQKELHTFYKDRENVPVPLLLAHQFITLKLKGATTKQELEQRLIEVRRIVNK